MKRFLLITNHIKDADYQVTDHIKSYLEARGAVCVKGPKSGVELQNFIKAAGQFTCAIVVGGDGTILQAARHLFSEDIALLGINMGTLGYLTEVEVQNVDSALDRLLEGNYTVENRMLLEGEMNGRFHDIAFNDIVVTRNASLHLVYLKLYVNGEYLSSYPADGLIISTPTGSTAYNLSAGGPIVEPTASMILITPICCHSLNKSSIVLSAMDEIVVEIGSRRGEESEEAVVTFDGTDITKVKTGDRVTIRKSNEVTKLVKLSNISFLETMREKMKGN